MGRWIFFLIFFSREGSGWEMTNWVLSLRKIFGCNLNAGAQKYRDLFSHSGWMALGRFPMRTRSAYVLMAMGERSAFIFQKGIMTSSVCLGFSLVYLIFPSLLPLVLQRVWQFLQTSTRELKCPSRSQPQSGQIPETKTVSFSGSTGSARLY